MPQTAEFRRIFFSSYIGNMLETYDFVLCGILATKMSQVFFPSGDSLSSLLLMLIAYGVGFVFRPLGAVIFGYIGDTRGRKTALFYSLLGMSFCTAGCGLLPGYETIGTSSSILFFAFRTLQGICIGGEAQGGSTFVIEHFWHHDPGASGAFFATSNGLGALLATIVSLIFLSIDTQSTHIWRYPFLFGSMVGVVGFFIRRFVPETPIFKKYASLSNPITSSLRCNTAGWLRAFCYFALITSVTQFGFTFVNIYLHTFLGFEKTAALAFACIGTVLAMSGVGMTGMFLKRYNVELSHMIHIGSWLTFIMAPFVMLLLASGNFTQIIVALFILAFFTGILCGTAPYFIALQFKHDHRYSGSALVSNLASGLIGGFFPTIGVFLLKATHAIIMPGVYIAGLAMLFLGVDWFLRRGDRGEKI